MALLSIALVFTVLARLYAVERGQKIVAGPIFLSLKQNQKNEIDTKIINVNLNELLKKVKRKQIDDFEFQ